MNKYNYKGIEFETDLKFFKASISKSHSITEDAGVVMITGKKSLIKESKEITRLKNYYFNYNSALFRRKTTESINIKIYRIVGVKEVIKVEDEYNLILVLPEVYDLNNLENDLSGLHLEYISGAADAYKEVNLLFDRDINVLGSTKLIDPSVLNEQYILDMTQALAGVIEFLEKYLAKEDFILKHYPLSEEVDTTEIVTFSYTEFPNNRQRHWPNYDLNYSEYVLPMKLRVTTASIAKHERLLADYNSLKWLSNQVRIKVKDKYDYEWNIPFEWEPTIESSDPMSDPKDTEGNTSFQLDIDFKIRFHNIRDNSVTPILEIIKKIGLFDGDSIGSVLEED